MTSQTPEECRHCKVAEAQGVTHIHPEETEIEEVSDCELYDHIPVPYDVAFWHCSVCGKELYFNTIEALLSQQQKHREELQKAVQEEKLKHCCCLIEDSKVIESCKLHGDELKKAREDMLHTLDSSIDNVTYAPKKPSDYKAWQDGFMEAYQQARKLIKRSELDTTSPVYKFFTASEEVRRPAIEEALKKASQEHSELDQDKK